MYTAIRHYRIGSGTVEEMTKVVEQEFADRIPELVQAVAYTAIDTGEGTAVTITVFPDEELFRKAARVVADLQRDLGERFGVVEESLLHGEVMINRASETVAETVHYAP
ncbi:hypothetical protein [Microlunatus sp. GCM10028923]|uniref:hypothetical protein n=1 Tax=Microlunatus sp. GCM10028923 TaxID=3273400 RepID=UPI003615A273